MRKQLPFLIILLISLTAHAQKKSELFAEIEQLKSEKQGLGQELAEAKREISSSKAKADALEAENISLRDANATLLTNLTSFSELSRKNSENVNKTLQALQQKERQLSGINEMIAANDSTAIVLLTKVKQILGDGANADFSEGDVIISGSLNTLFGSDTSVELSEAGLAWVSKIAEVLKANPERKPEVVGLNITGEFGLTYDQANVVAKTLTDTHQVPAEKLSVSVQDGNFKEGISIKLRPDYEAFYGTVKESVKTSQ
ncbi:hypothetical protein [Flagellimonas allohymeniacidonis]|uniref:OmpA family protein n=1 Tax=Flagellimonas allohymeniacidonis TaxID=2517819 RepID=A0A4Q8QI12_9FLAO|nr:hypothetical protein [Allomuricauda hymeniacidonis]TAI48938.1 hypothetical protein EW142_03845 [Allomuricauda hymeniacidonis]